MTDPRKPTSDAPHGIGRKFTWLDMLLLSMQIALLCLFQFGDIGFDHPGKLRLDFGDFILICIIYGISLIAGLAYSVAKKHWISAVLQVCIPIAVFAFNIRPSPRYDAAQYQHLKGKSKSEVEKILGTRGAVTGFEGHPDGDREFAAYSGMTVIYSSKGRVMAVIPDND
jgi:hypothetical protein